MPKPKCCEYCGTDVTATYEPDDPDTGIVAGWYCDTCGLGIADEGDDDDPEAP